MKNIVILFLLVAAATAQIVPDQYIVPLSSDPVARLAARQGRRLTVDQRDFAPHRAIILREQAKARQAIEASGGVILDSFDTVANALVVNIAASQASALSAAPGVIGVHPVRLYHPALDR